MAAIAIAVSAAGCVGYAGSPRQWQGDYAGRQRNGQRDADYQCVPCRQRFRDWDEFRTHLHRYHGIPWARIPSALVRVGLGWLYRG